MRRFAFVLVATFCALASSGQPFAPLPPTAAKAAPGDETFVTVAGATAHLWSGGSMALGTTGGTLPPSISAVFQWSNTSQSFKFWFRGFPVNFNTLASLEKNGFYFFQGSGGVPVTIEGSANYTLPAGPTTFQTIPGATGQLWLGGPLPPEQLPVAISAVFRWNNTSQSFQFWFRGFPSNFNTLPPMLAQGEFYFLQSNTVATVNAPTAAAPGSSAALIDQAVANGTLPLLTGTTTAESSLVYKVFADFGDPRLPGAFSGSTTGGEPGPGAAQHAYATASPAAQALLLPFISRPATSGSWVDLLFPAAGRSPVLWDTVSSARVKVWWRQDRPQDQTKAQGVLDAIENTIWTPLTTLMGVSPPSDAGCTDNGGDSKFDVYLVGSLPAVPGAAGYQAWCGDPAVLPVASSTVVIATYPQASLNATVAHEFMHALQYTFSDALIGGGYDWLLESTATWAVDFVYPAGQSEHGFAVDFVNGMSGGNTLTSYVYTTGPQYGAYLWWWYLTTQLSNNLIKQVWQMSHSGDIVQDMATLLGGEATLQQRWRDFALNTLGVGNANYFLVGDGLDLAGTPGTTIITDSSNRPFEVSVAPLGLGRVRIDTAARPDYARVRIENPFFDIPNVTVQLLVKRGGAWDAPITLPNEFQRFCGLIPSGGIDELAVIVTNANVSGNPVTDSVRFEFSDAPCTIHLATSVTQDYQVAGDEPLERHWTITASFDMELRTGPDTGEYIYDSVAGGTINWSLNDVECTPHNQGGSFAIGSQTTSTVGYARFRVDEPGVTTYFTPAVFNPTNLENLRTTCGSTLTDTDPPQFWFVGPNGKPGTAWEDGFTSTYSFQDATGDTTLNQLWSWTMTNK